VIVLLINCSPVRDGATAEIVEKVMNYLSDKHTIKTICIDDYDIKFCKGCKSCYINAKCIYNDDIFSIMKEFELADIIISVAPSYWADIPGQFKAFIDRCTPWCNTHEPHSTIGKGKKGYTIALRTGANEKECKRIVENIEHFYGHLEIEAINKLCLCSVKNKVDVEARTHEIKDFCNQVILSK
jgi:multimeric flavodoxin WrbA